MLSMPTVDPKPRPAAERSGKLYEMIEKVICERISNGTLEPGARLARIDELAREMEVSPGTIRHSLQNLAAKGILIRRRRAGAFVAHQQPVALSDRRLGNEQSITLLMPDIAQPEYAHLARAVQNVAREMKLDVLIDSTDDELSRYEQAIQRQLKSGTHGIIMVPPLSGNLPLSLLHAMQTSRLPVVTIFRSVGGTGWPTVLTDYQYDIESTTRHLLNVGCRKIAFCNLIEQADTMDRKYHAFLRTLIQERHPPREELLLTLPGQHLSSTPQSRSERHQIMRTWLRGHPDVDGICCVHDELAVGILSILKELGRRVPEEIAVAGCGNYAVYYGLPADNLTTIDTRYDQIAANACNLLQRIRQGDAVEEGIQVAIKGDLIPGNSTLRAPSHSAIHRSQTPPTTRRAGRVSSSSGPV